MPGPYYFAVWEWKDGKHAGYVDHSPINAPLLSRHAVGYRGAEDYRDAAESVARHVASRCDGHCQKFLEARDAAARGAE